MEVTTGLVDPIAVAIPLDGETLYGDLQLATNAQGTIVFVHGSGSSRFSPRNREVAMKLMDAGFNTLLTDLLTEKENEMDSRTMELRFDIPLLARRSTAVAEWVSQEPRLKDLRIGLFGASTGAAAALITAAEMPSIAAVVSRGGRPDLAGRFLDQVQAPTLLIVGGHDEQVLELNRRALADLRCTKYLRIIPLATHLFEEPGALQQVATAASEWFASYLKTPRQETKSARRGA